MKFKFEETFDMVLGEKDEVVAAVDDSAEKWVLFYTCNSFKSVLNLL